LERSHFRSRAKEEEAKKGEAIKEKEDEIYQHMDTLQELASARNQIEELQDILASR